MQGQLGPFWLHQTTPFQRPVLGSRSLSSQVAQCDDAEDVAESGLDCQSELSLAWKASACMRESRGVLRRRGSKFAHVISGACLRRARLVELRAKRSSPGFLWYHVLAVNALRLTVLGEGEAKTRVR